MARYDEGGGGGNSPAVTLKNVAKNVLSAGTKAAQTQQKKNTAAKKKSSGGSSKNYGYSKSNSGSSKGYSSYSGGNSYRPSSGTTSSGIITPTVPKPVIPKFDQAYLKGDTAYSQQKNAFAKALADYAAQSKADIGNYNTEYSASLDKIGKDQTLNAQALKDDYASRGLLNSGVYADAFNDFNSEYDTKRADLARAKAAYTTDQTTAQGNFKTEQQLLLDKAYQDALNRYNDKYK